MRASDCPSGLSCGSGGRFGSSTSPAAIRSVAASIQSRQACHTPRSWACGAAATCSAEARAVAVRETSAFLAADAAIAHVVFAVFSLEIEAAYRDALGA
jgi:hypothetical protein